MWEKRTLRRKQATGYPSRDSYPHTLPTSTHIHQPCGSQQTLKQHTTDTQATHKKIVGNRFLFSHYYIPLLLLMLSFPVKCSLITAVPLYSHGARPWYVSPYFSTVFWEWKLNEHLLHSSIRTSKSNQCLSSFLYETQQSMVGILQQIISSCVSHTQEGKSEHKLASKWGVGMEERDK